MFVKTGVELSRSGKEQQFEMILINNIPVKGDTYNNMIIQYQHAESLKVMMLMVYVMHVIATLRCNINV